ncbi:IS481 family transposase [Stutzerimonas kunmingensis]|uniref:IS481 family transposase n=1 Tax=Stutzerimonas kunmingensis TaxID=1211807 RepID=UPI0039C8C535
MIAALSKRYNLNPKTVRKWHNRETIEDAPMGPSSPHSTSMTPLQEAAAVAFRQKTLLPLDDCLLALQRTIPTLTRSSLHRLYQRHGISQLPREPAREKKPFKHYPMGYLHIDITETRTAEGKAYLFVAIDRTTKFVHAELFEQMTRKTAIDFLKGTLKALPYHVHTILTDNGIQFAKKAGTETYREHPFDVLCNQHGIEHRLTKPFHPWTNGQVERMNRTIKDATTKAFYYTSLEELRSHLKDYFWAYNSARPLRVLKGRTPIGFILDQRHKAPQHFKDAPGHYFLGPNTWWVFIDCGYAKALSTAPVLPAATMRL